jgi:DNA-binding MarR family transcriptional regulator
MEAPKTKNKTNNTSNVFLGKRDIDPQDRRYVNISLTASGGKLFESIEESRNQYYLSIFNAIPQEKREQVIESLQLLLEALDNNSCCC